MTTSEKINIFVFGSNLAGRHGKGAAKVARDLYGAIYGQGEGLQGRSYGIPTKDINIKTLPLTTIEHYVVKFQLFALEHQEYNFILTRVGCGLAGYTDADMAPLFKDMPSNCILPQEWINYLKEN